MFDGPLVFVDVDTQRDFLDSAGSLYISGSVAILPNLARLTNEARVRSIPVIATACAHRFDEVDPEPFPPHCLIGTQGQRRVAETEWPGSVILSPESTLAVSVPLPSHLTLEKRRYDILSREDARSIISRYSRNHATFVVYGVATDYCVRAAVLGIASLGFPVVVVADAVWAIEQDRQADQFAEFVAIGACLTITDVILGLSTSPVER